jgi:hypothetical protein
MSSQEQQYLRIGLSDFVQTWMVASSDATFQFLSEHLGVKMESLRLILSESLPMLLLRL